MKKTFLFILAGLLPIISQANPVVKPTPANQQTLLTMMHIQQQLINMQQNMLALQKQQLALQNSLLMQTAQSVSGNFKWVTMSSTSDAMPDNRINAGLTAGPAVYICHAQYQDLGVHPGTLTDQGCLISYAGKSYIEKTYQILTGTSKVSWKPSSALDQFRRPVFAFEAPGPIVIPAMHPQNSFPLTSGNLPIVGGNEEGDNLYICRTIVDNNIHVGKVVSGNCNVGYNGEEYVKPDYQVLFS